MFVGIAQAQSRYPANRSPTLSGGSLVLPGGVDTIPHLEEIGWDTDLPFLLAVRFVPQKLSFAAGWDQAAQGEMFHEVGIMKSTQPYPWPHFFIPGAGTSMQGLAGLKPDDMAKFQDWSMKRATTLPSVIVHSVPIVMLPGQAALTVRPLGIAEDEEPDNQQAEGVGFTTTMWLRVDKLANDYAVPVPSDVLARLPRSDVRLETRVRWHDPQRVEQRLIFVTQPISLKLVVKDNVLWEHVY